MAGSRALLSAPPRFGRRGLLLGALTAVAGCKPHQAKENVPMTMKEIRSGYATSPADWLALAAVQF